MMKSTSFFIFLPFLLFPAYCQNHPIVFDYSYNDTAPYNITLCLGKRDNCFPFLISTSITESMIIGRRKLKPENYKTFTKLSENINIGIYKGRSWTGYEVKDLININNTDIEINDYKFIFVKNGLYLEKYHGIIGLGNSYKRSGIESDFLGLLTEKGLIDKSIFTFGNRKLFLGSAPDFPFTTKLPKICKTRDKKYINPTYFFCIIDVVIYQGRKEMLLDDSSDQIRFNLEQYEISCTQAFYKLLIEKIFTPYIETKLCQEIKAKAKFLESYIICEDKVIEELGDDEIFFIIGKWSIKFKIKELFKNKKFLITFNESIDNWVFGLVLGKYYFVTLDKENHVAVFSKIKNE